MSYDLFPRKPYVKHLMQIMEWSACSRYGFASKYNCVDNCRFFSHCIATALEKKVYTTKKYNCDICSEFKYRQKTDANVQNRAYIIELIHTFSVRPHMKQIHEEHYRFGANHVNATQFGNSFRINNDLLFLKTKKNLCETVTL